ncbi:MAG: APC family permease [Candidatus Eremiobacteraeota bacterium]|nr:APC family permease [Candidatus Eremiobacteraeota bacterium]
MRGSICGHASSTSPCRLLRKVLSLFDLSVLASASMGPAFSLASTLGVMVAVAGGLAIAALGAITVVLLLVALAFVQLTARYPDAGSSYGWARRAFGEGAGAYAAWILLVANFFAVLATAVPAGSYTLALLAPQRVDSAGWVAAVGCLWIVACSLILYLGVRSTARVAAMLLVAELVVLAASAFAGFAAPPATAQTAPSNSVSIGAFIGAMVLGIWMVDGWEVTAATSEETRGVTRTAGIGGVIGLLVTAAFLFVCTVAYLHAGGVAGIAAHQVDALAFVGTQLGGIWHLLLIATVLVSLTATLETTLLYLVRSVYAMGRDGVLPFALGRLDMALAGVCAAALAAMVLVGLVPTANAGLQLVLNGSAVFLGVLFLISCAAALRLRGDGTPLFAAAGGLALVVILAVAVAQAAGPTRWSIIGALVIGIPIALGFAARKRSGKVQGPAAGNIGG